MSEQVGRRRERRRWGSEGWQRTRRRSLPLPPCLPARAADVAGMPATLLPIAEADPLRDEGLAYAARLNAAEETAGSGPVGRSSTGCRPPPFPGGG